MAREQLLEQGSSPLYVRVAHRLRDWIESGTYIPGAKVPSVRELSQKLDVSISTVLQSYDMLENQGYIEARPQSGYYVRSRALCQTPALSRPASAPRFVQSNDTYLDVIRSCGASDLVPLGSARVDASLLPTEGLNRALIKVLREQGDAAISYDRVAGHWELRQEIARRSLESGCSFEPEQILTSTGCMEALQLALRAVTKPGDVVAVESPTYYGILHALESLALKVLELPAGPIEGVDLEQFEDKLKKFNIKAAIITPSFQNPLGFLMPDENKEKLVQLCEKYDVAVIEDDIYADLNFEGQRPSALKSFDKKDRVFVCSSFSKTLAPGYRVGWVVPPEKQKDNVERLKFSMTTSTNTAAQMAIADFLKTHNYDRFLRKLRQTLSQNVHQTTRRILESFPEGTKVSQPKGGCLLWLELPNKVNTMLLHQKALKEGISVIPGGVFSANGKYQNNLRINCGSAWNERLEKAIAHVGTLAHKLIE